MKSQEELDRLVIEAAEEFEKNRGPSYGSLFAESAGIVDAVRARREAKLAREPSKLRLLAAACWNGTSTPSEINIKTSLEKYDQDGYPSRASLEAFLSRLLSARDETPEERGA